MDIHVVSDKIPDIWVRLCCQVSCTTPTNLSSQEINLVIIKILFQVLGDCQWLYTPGEPESLPVLRLLLVAASNFQCTVALSESSQCCLGKPELQSLHRDANWKPTQKSEGFQGTRNQLA